MGDVVTPGQWKTIGSRIREVRVRSGLSQKAFAAVTMVTHVDQHLFEADVRLPNVSYLLTLQRYGLDAEWILFGRGNLREQDRTVLFKLAAPMFASGGEDVYGRKFGVLM